MNLNFLSNFSGLWVSSEPTFCADSKTVHKILLLLVAQEISSLSKISRATSNKEIFFIPGHKEGAFGQIEAFGQ